MDKINKFNKYLYIFIFSIISVLVFLLNIEECYPYYLNSSNAVTNFFTEIYRSLERFDIIYVSLWIFILYFYSSIYFDGNKMGKSKIICIVMSIFFALLTVVGKSYNIDNTLNVLYSSSGQVCKTFIYLFGYYLIYYAIIKKIFNIKLNDLFFWKKIDDNELKDGLKNTKKKRQ